MATGAYRPYESGKRPGGRPDTAPAYRVLVHRKYRDHYEDLAERVGLQQAQQFWDHIAQIPGKPSPIAQTCFLRGKAGVPMGPGWSRTVHYELTGSARADYQFHNAFTTGVGGDPHAVVAILTLDYSSH
jgi:hypothetical protein